MMAKPIRALELLYPMIQSLIIIILFYLFGNVNIRWNYRTWTLSKERTCHVPVLQLTYLINQLINLLLLNWLFHKNTINLYETENKGGSSITNLAGQVYWWILSQRPSPRKRIHPREGLHIFLSHKTFFQVDLSLEKVSPSTQFCFLVSGIFFQIYWIKHGVSMFLIWKSNCLLEIYYFKEGYLVFPLRNHWNT